MMFLFFWAAGISLAVIAADQFPGHTLDLDGGEYVEVPYSAELNPAQFTVSFWAKVEGGSGTFRSVITSRSDSTGFMFYASNDGHWEFWTRNNDTASNIIEGPSFSQDIWYHIAGTYDGSDMILYVNGVISGHLNSVNYIPNFEFPLFIGAGNTEETADYFFNGKIDELSLWNVARSVEDIREDMHRTLSGSESGLVSYWQFNEGEGTVLSDCINSFNGILINCEEEDWLFSEIPSSRGYSNTFNISSTGSFDYGATVDALLDFTSKTGTDSVVITKILDAPNILPSGSDAVYNSQYWIIEKFGSGTFIADMTLVMHEGIYPDNVSRPEYLKLYRRSSNSDGDWSFISTAVSSNSSSDQVTFSGITSEGQYLVCADSPPVLSIFDDPDDFYRYSDNFSSINIGYYDYSAPEITDIDGDGLLDLLIGEDSGNLNRYEQSGINSMSFDLVSSNFNSIDIGYHSAPVVSDIDNNGLLDLLIGEYEGNINRYEQERINSPVFILRAENFNNIDVGSYSIPDLSDIDGDGQLDLLIGNYSGNIFRYEQDSPNSLTFVLRTENFNNIDVGSFSSPAVSDIDQNGLLDLLIGESSGNINRYEQTVVNSLSFSLITESFESIDIGDNSIPVIADISGGNRPEIMIGEKYGNLNLYRPDNYIYTLDFGSHDVSTISDPLNYYISANFLTSDISLQSPDGFKLSTDSISGFQQSLNLTPANGQLSEVIYARFEPSAAGSYSGKVINTSTDINVENPYLRGYGSAFDTDGIPGFALDVDGGEYVEVTYSADVNPNQFTVSFWVKPEGGAGTFRSVVTSRSSTTGFMFYAGDDDNWQFWIRDGDATSNKIIGPPVVLNEWTHVAGSFDGSNMILYVNGEISGHLNGVSLIPNTQYPLRIGAGNTEGSADYYFNGKIDEMVVYNSAIPTETIRERMHRPLGGYEDNVTAYWQFNEGTGTTLNDPLGNSGTLVNCEEEDWLSSAIPLGSGNAETINISTAGTYDFGWGTDVDMEVTEKTGTDSVVVTKITIEPNILPTGTDQVHAYEYWAINQFGGGTITTDISFDLYRVFSSISSEYESQPHFAKLFRRDIASDSTWDYVSDATSIDTSTDIVTFSGITQPGQYMIGYDDLPEVFLSEIPLNFVKTDSTYIYYWNKVDLININDYHDRYEILTGEEDGTVNYRYKYETLGSGGTSLGIDVGNESDPESYDIDGDGLLDLLIGETDGNINHYEQLSVGSTDFTLITENFNSIDVGQSSSPDISDIDGDGLLDLLIGCRFSRHLYHYEQDSPNSYTFNYVTDSFSGITGSNYTFLTPHITDIDDDGLLDLLIGNELGYISHWKQDSPDSYNFSLITDNWLDICVDFYSAPETGYILNELGMSLFVGTGENYIYRYKEKECEMLDFGTILKNNEKVISYKIKGQNLEGNIDLSSNHPYYISSDSLSGFSNSISLTAAGEDLIDTVFVKFAPDSVKVYNSDLSHSSVNISTVNLPLFGEVYILIPENLLIDISGSDLILSWDAVAGASSYKVYSCDDPYGTFTEDTGGIFAGETWAIPYTESKKFYYVVAVDSKTIPSAKKKINVKKSLR